MLFVITLVIFLQSFLELCKNSTFGDLINQKVHMMIENDLISRTTSKSMSYSMLLLFVIEYKMIIRWRNCNFCQIFCIAAPF